MLQPLLDTLGPMTMAELTKWVVAVPTVHVIIPISTICKHAWVMVNCITKKPSDVAHRAAVVGAHVGIAGVGAAAVPQPVEGVLWY